MQKHSLVRPEYESQLQLINDKFQTMFVLSQTVSFFLFY